MWRQLALTALAALLGACASAPIVYAPGDLEHHPATGKVTPLADLLPGLAPVRLVFVHGVGDHCFGYALDPQNGWLDDAAARSFGLTPEGGLLGPYPINAGTYMKHAPDRLSYVQYGTRRFRSERGYAVEAIEITWSHLTQWVKTNQLSYDAPSTVSDLGHGDLWCVEPPDHRIVPAIKSPPTRLLLNRIVKEEVFDRKLADAILYAGSYGAVIERGVAEALCHAINTDQRDAPCTWPRPGNDPHRYVFVTHSLGSRILYDALIDLSSDTTQVKPSPFEKEERAQAGPFVDQLLAHTPAIYMMANQLALVGLANVPRDARSDELLRPFVVIEPLGAAEPRERPDQDRTPLVDPNRCTTTLGKLAALHARAQVRLRSPGPALRLVAFNDTNDLLTWHVPGWYAKEGPRAADCRPPVELANVFVQNAAHLLVLESPGPAHLDYFRRREVRDIIQCGAENGRARPCR